MLMCKIRPDTRDCRMYMNNDGLFGKVRNCADCLAQDHQYEIIDVSSIFLGGDYAIVLKDGKNTKISLTRICDVKEVQMESKTRRIIAVDFDGTLCEEKWPEIGEPNEEIIHYLKKRQTDGDKLILWTCRVGEKLERAVRWSMDHGLRFDAVNENLPEVLEWMGGDSRKIFADEYIDDRNVPVDSLLIKRRTE